MTSYLTREQVEQILRPINPVRVSERDGMSYVEAYEEKAHMARIFGICRWSSEVLEQLLLFEEKVKTKNGKDAWYVGYRSVVKVTVCAPDGTQLAIYTEGHAGDSTHPSRGEAHGNAITNSESYAFKRCVCMALLDQGGLSLYGKGSKQALVKRTLVMPDAPVAEQAADPVDHDTAPVAPEQDTDSRTTPVVASEPVGASSELPAPATPTGSSSPEADVEQLRERVLATADLPKGERSRALARIGVEIARARLQQAQTADANGQPIMLGMLHDRMLQLAARSSSSVRGNVAADRAAGEPADEVA